MIIAIAAAAIVVIGGVAFAVMKGGERPRPTKGSGSEGARAATPKKKKKDEAKPLPKVSQRSRPRTPASSGRARARLARRREGCSRYRGATPTRKQNYEAHGRRRRGGPRSWTRTTPGSPYIIGAVLAERHRSASPRVDGGAPPDHQQAASWTPDERPGEELRSSAGSTCPEMRAGGVQLTWAQWWLRDQATATRSRPGPRRQARPARQRPGAAPRVAARIARRKRWEETLAEVPLGRLHNFARIPSTTSYQRIKGDGQSPPIPT